VRDVLESPPVLGSASEFFERIGIHTGTDDEFLGYTPDNGISPVLEHTPMVGSLRRNPENSERIRVLTTAHDIGRPRLLESLPGGAEE
jgi:hypothetical protein